MLDLTTADLLALAGGSSDSPPCEYLHLLVGDLILCF
jgi:hypothetical protein